MRRAGGAGCLSVLLGSLLGSTGVMPLAAQTVPGDAPAGVRLKVAETGIDFGAPSRLLLHLQIVNGSDRAVTVWPGMSSLVAVNDPSANGQGADKGASGEGRAGSAGRRCDTPPDSTRRSAATPKILRPGGLYEETLSLNTDVCRGLLEARAVQVERVVFTGEDQQARVVSEAIPVRNGRSEENEIKAMLAQQAADWNRGDLTAFATGYKTSPDILFIGRTINRGYDAMLLAYKQGYDTREKMGTLGFSQLEIQPLDARFATVTGRFHLERREAGGGNADGYFLLVVEDTASGWKIVRDDTTALPAPKAP